MPNTSEEAALQETVSGETMVEPSDAEEYTYEQLLEMYDESLQNLAEGEVVTGKVISITSNSVVVDVGYKSEGLIPLQEFTNHQGELMVEVGDKVDVLLERTEDQEGDILLSKVKADRMKVWEQIETAYQNNEVVNGYVIDRIKGGLTVDIGIRAFLPGSLADIKPIKHLDSLKGRELEFKVISLDRRRNNIVLSRKAVLEKELEGKKAETIEMLAEGVRMPGVVKNITDYGVFIDLGGIDGLLHITDISWGRVNHPSEHFSVGEEVNVIVLKFDAESERVSLGYKQLSEDPWTLVDKKYPVGSRVHGKVVSIVDYGAFVELEEGVEGLIHVSEMSWTKKVVNPSKIVDVDQEVEAIVSELDMGQRRISLSLRQTERNPWEELADLHPVGSIVEGKVRNITDFGAFVEITEGIDGLIHVSDMSWTKRIKHPSEVLKKGDSVKARITNIDAGNQRVSLSIKEFLHDEWDSFVDEYRVGDMLEGKIVNVTDFGLFIDIYNGLEGLAHVSEIDVAAGERLEDNYRVGDFVRARILRIEDAERKVGLTMRGVTQPTGDEMDELREKDAKKEPRAPRTTPKAAPVAVDSSSGFGTMGAALSQLMGSRDNDAEADAEAGEESESVIEAAEDAVSEAVDKAKDASAEVVDKVEEVADKAKKAGAKAAKNTEEVAEKVADKVAEETEDAKEAAAEVVEKAEEVAEEVAEKVVAKAKKAKKAATKAAAKVADEVAEAVGGDDATSEEE